MGRIIPSGDGKQRSESAARSGASACLQRPHRSPGKAEKVSAWLGSWLCGGLTILVSGFEAPKHIKK